MSSPNTNNDMNDDGILDHKDRMMNYREMEDTSLDATNSMSSPNTHNDVKDDGILDQQDRTMQYRKMEDTTLDALFPNNTDGTDFENQPSAPYQQMQDENNNNNDPPAGEHNGKDNTDNDKGVEGEATPYQQMQDEELALAAPYSFEKVASSISQKSQEIQAILTQKSQEIAEIVTQKSQEAAEVLAEKSQQVKAIVEEESKKAAVVVSKKSQKAARVLTKQSKKAAVAMSQQGNEVVAVLSEQSLLPPMGNEKERDLSRYAALLAAIIMASIFYTTWFIFELVQFLPDMSWENDGRVVLHILCIVFVGILASVLFVRVMQTKARLAMPNPAKKLARRRCCPSKRVRRIMAFFCFVSSTGYFFLYFDANIWIWLLRWFPWFITGMLVIFWVNKSLDEMDDFDRMMIRENEKEDPTEQEILKISTF